MGLIAMSERDVQRIEVFTFPINLSSQPRLLNRGCRTLVFGSIFSDR